MAHREPERVWVLNGGARTEPDRRGEATAYARADLLTAVRDSALEDAAAACEAVAGLIGKHGSSVRSVKRCVAAIRAMKSEVS